MPDIEHSQASSGVTVAQLEAVVAVVDYGSFTAAADVLGISQPSLSRRIRVLEALVGSPVFIQAGKQMTLTAIGEQLSVAARKTLRELAAVNGLAASSLSLSTGSLRLIGLPSLLATVVPAYLGAFHQAHPGVQVEVFAAYDTAELFDAVRLGRADGAVGPTKNVPDDLTMSFWQDQTFQAVLPGRPGATPARGLNEDLGRRTLVTLPRGTSIRTVTDEAYKQLEAVAPQIITTTQRDMLVPLAVEAAGITVVPAELARTAESAGGQAVRFPFPVGRSIGMIYRNDGRKNPAFARFLQSLPQS